MGYARVDGTDATTFAGADIGTPQFNQRLGSTMRAWADHAREIGIDPGQIAILLIDEPSSDKQDPQIVAWGRPIKAAAPELLIFEDPHRPNLLEHDREMLEICDIICPSRRKYIPGKPQVNLLDELRDGGRQLWFYSGSLPATTSAISFRKHGWHCWKAKATGTGYWSYGDAGQQSNS